VSRRILIGQFSPIALLHEVGQALGLYHPEEGESPVAAPICSVPTVWIGCTHYCGVGGNDVTGLGDMI